MNTVQGSEFDVRSKGRAEAAAGKVEEETQAIVSNMLLQDLSILALCGILLSDKGKVELRRVLHDFVHQSTEIQAAIVELMERPPAA